MLSIKQVNLTDSPSLKADDMKAIIKRSWLRLSLFLDRMAIASLYPELSNPNTGNDVRVTIRRIGRGHAAKARLLRRLTD